MGKERNRTFDHLECQGPRNPAGQQPGQWSAEDLSRLIHGLEARQTAVEIRNQELRRSQAELDASRKRYSDLYDFAPAGYVTLDRFGMILEANLTMADELGVPRGQLTAVPFAKFIVAEDRNLFYIRIRTSLKNSYRQTCRVRLQRRDGTRFFASLETIVFRDSVGEPAYRTLVIDVTEQKQREDALRASEAEYFALLERAKDGILIVQKGLIVFVNQALADICGFAAEKMIGSPFFYLLAPEYRREIGELLRSGFAGEKLPPLVETRYVCSDGTIKDVEVSLQLIQFKGRPAHMEIVRDITERKKAEIALTRRAEELARSNRELEKFAFVVSHDLQEPLRMVGAYLRLFTRKYRGGLDAAAGEFITHAVEGANRMQTLIRDLLACSRVTTRAEPFQAVDCEDVLARVIADLRLAVRKSKATITHDPLPTVYGDSTQLGQLFQNLISNAVKFRRDEPPRVHISATEEDGQWHFSVQDNGIGIEQQHAERIFVMFQRLQPRTKFPGTGIGLAVSKKNVERHNGRIWVVSEPGKGSTFWFTIGPGGDGGTEIYPHF